MTASSNRDLEALAGRYGFKLVRKTRHFIFRHSNGEQVVTSKTCNDWRRLKNVERDFKRALQTTEQEARHE